MEMQLYLVVLLEIYQLVLLMVFLDFVVELYWGQFIDTLTCTFSTRQLQPEPEKSVVGDEVATKVKEPKEIPAEELETCRNDPAELKDQPQEAIQIIDSLPDVNQYIDNQPRHQSEDLAMGYLSDDTNPNKLYPWSLIKEVSSTFGSQTKPRIDLRLLEPFNPEKPDNVVVGLQAVNQSRQKPENPQVLPQIPEECGPKDIPAEVIPQSNEQLETNEKKPEPESLTENLQETIYDSTGNVTSEDPEGEIELIEIAKEEGDEEDEGDNAVLMPKNSEVTNEEMDKILLNTKDLPTVSPGNGNPIELDINSPKQIRIKVVRGVNFPEAKDSDQFYVSMRIEEWHGEICYQDKKFKSKTIRGSQPEWNKDFTIQTQNPESCLMTLKIKKSSKLGSKTSTVGFIKMVVSDLMHDENSQVSAMTIQLNDESYNPVSEACLELDMKVGDLPEVVASPAEVKRQERKLKARKILCQRHGIKPRTRPWAMLTRS